MQAFLRLFYCNVCTVYGAETLRYRKPINKIDPPDTSSPRPNPELSFCFLLLFVTLERIDEKVNISRHICLLLPYASRFMETKIQKS